MRHEYGQPVRQPEGRRKVPCRQTPTTWPGQDGGLAAVGRGGRVHLVHHAEDVGGICPSGQGQPVAAVLGLNRGFKRVLPEGPATTPAGL